MRTRTYSNSDHCSRGLYIKYVYQCSSISLIMSIARLEAFTLLLLLKNAFTSQVPQLSSSSHNRGKYCKLEPPSTGIPTPVQWAPALDDKNKANPPISSGVPTRPVG